MPKLLELLLDNDKPNKNQPVFKLLAKSCFVAEDQELREAVNELHWRSQVFDSLRTAMGIAPVGGSQGLNDEGSTTAMATIRQGVESFRRFFEKSDVATGAEQAIIPCTGRYRQCWQIHRW